MGPSPSAATLVAQVRHDFGEQRPRRIGKDSSPEAMGPRSARTGVIHRRKKPRSMETRSRSSRHAVRSPAICRRTSVHPIRADWSASSRIRIISFTRRRSARMKDLWPVARAGSPASAVRLLINRGGTSRARASATLVVKQAARHAAGRRGPRLRGSATRRKGDARRHRGADQRPRGSPTTSAIKARRSVKIDGPGQKPRRSPSTRTTTHDCRRRRQVIGHRRARQADSRARSRTRTSDYDREKLQERLAKLGPAA